MDSLKSTNDSSSDNSYCVVFNGKKVYNKFNYKWNNEDDIRAYYRNYYHAHKPKTTEIIDGKEKEILIQKQWYCDVCDKVYSANKSRHNKTKKHLQKKHQTNTSN